jgi:hypothetical protein
MEGSLLALFTEKWNNCVRFIGLHAASVVGPSSALLLNGVLNGLTPEEALLRLATYLPQHRQRILEEDFTYFRKLLCEMLNTQTLVVPEPVEAKLMAYGRFFLDVLDEVSKSHDP